MEDIMPQAIYGYKAFHIVIRSTEKKKFLWKTWTSSKCDQNVNASFCIFHFFVEYMQIIKYFCINMQKCNNEMNALCKTKGKKHQRLESIQKYFSIL